MCHSTITVGLKSASNFPFYLNHSKSCLLAFLSSEWHRQKPEEFPKTDTVLRDLQPPLPPPGGWEGSVCTVPRTQSLTAEGRGGGSIPQLSLTLRRRLKTVLWIMRKASMGRTFRVTLSTINSRLEGSRSTL